MRELIASFRSTTILVIGDIVADHYIYGQTERVSREAPVLIVRHERDETKLGGAANVAANVRSLGGKVTLFGALGNDPVGREVKQQLKHRGIGLQALEVESTETKTRILAGGVNTTRQQMLRIDRSSRIEAAPSRTQAFLKKLKHALSRVDAVVVSDYGSGIVSAQVRAILKDAAMRGLPVCVDSRFSLSEFVGPFIIKPNEPELATLTRRSIETMASLKDAARQALHQLDASALVVTRGRSGIAVFEPMKAPVLIPAHGLADAVDVTGAGDTVGATLGLCLGGGASLEIAAHVANIAGAIVVQKPGTATVSPDELVSA